MAGQEAHAFLTDLIFLVMEQGGIGWELGGRVMGEANELGRKIFHVCSIVFQNVSWGPNHVICNIKTGVGLKYPKKTTLQNTSNIEKCFVYPFK